MRIRSLGSNQTELILNDGTVVLFSYETPVAAMVGWKLYRTAERHSTTTSRHIARWLNGRAAEEKPQEWFDGLLEEV